MFIETAATRGLKKDVIQKTLSMDLLPHPLFLPQREWRGDMEISRRILLYIYDEQFPTLPTIKQKYFLNQTKF